MNILSKIWISALLCLSFSSIVNAQAVHQIIDGTPATTAQFPWMGQIDVQEEGDSELVGQCGGTLIAPSWVLTAAHCFQDDEGHIGGDLAERTTLYFNTDDVGEGFSSDAIIVNATRVITHPDYQSDTVEHDIALIELESTVEATPISLFTGAIPAHLPTIVAGWGATLPDGSNTSDILLATQQLTVTQEECELFHGEDITSNMFCAGAFTDAATNDTCQGDSGGPLFVNLIDGGALQLGITSFGGEECGTPGEPGVYANIPELYSFILTHVPNNVAVDSLEGVKSYRNQYNDATELVHIPKVHADGEMYSAVLRHTGDLNFSLQSADLLTEENLDAVPSYFDGAANELILPLVQVGPEIFNVRLTHLGEFNFSVVTAVEPE